MSKNNNEIEVNGEIYIKKSCISQESKLNPVKIVILNRGWVVIGRVYEEKNKTFITNCSVIRIWGTTAGLGELAMNGKLKDTILDKCPDVEVETANVVFIMNCKQEVWKNV